MKKTKTLLSLFLVLSMIASFCPLPASAAESPSAPTISIEAHALSAAECSTYGVTGTDVYGLFFTGDPGVRKTLLMSTVLSYDNTVILPCDKAGAPQELSADLFKTIGKYKSTGESYEQLYTKLPFKGSVSGTTTTFESGVTVSDPSAVTVTGSQLMSVLFFKIAGNDVGVLNRSSLKIETAPAALDSVQASASAVYTTSDGAYSCPAIGQNEALALPALTYPNSDTKLVPTITTPPTATEITYGAALSTSVLSGGAASVPGTFAWDSGTDTPNAGTALHSVTFTPTDGANYATVTCNVSVTVQRKALTNADITIIPTPIPDEVYNNSACDPFLHIFHDSKELIRGTDYTVTYTNNINVGTANVAIDFIGNYSGSAAVTFQITHATPELTVTAADADYTGNPYGGSIQVDVSGSGGAHTLHYKVRTAEDSTYVADPPTAVGQYTVRATLAAYGNYLGATATADFEIKPLTTALSLGDIESYTYDNTAKTPTPTVKRGTTTLTLGTDYTLSYQNNTNAGTATVIATGRGNYTGATGSKTFPIAKSDAHVLTFTQAGYPYGGTLPAPSVTANTSSGTVTYAYYSDAACTAAITPTATTPAGTYYGKATVAATQNYLAKTTAAVSFVIAKAPYSGTAISGSATVEKNKVQTGLAYRLDALSLPAGFTDAAFVSAAIGAGTNTILDAASRSDATTLAYSVKSVSSGTGTIEAVISSRNYENYTVSITVSTVEIKPNWSAVTVKSIPYGSTLASAVTLPTGSATMAATVGGTPTTLTGTYTIATAGAATAKPTVGTAPVAIQFAITQGSHTGLVLIGSQDVTVTPLALTITPDAVSKTYGTALDPTLTYAVTPSISGLVPLVSLLQRADGTAAGHYDITLADGAADANPNYTLSLSGGADRFTIAPKALALSMLTEIPSAPYTGKPQRPAPTVTDGGALTAGTDYTVAYENNTNAGTANIILTGRGNYTGSVTGAFTISTLAVTVRGITAESKGYDGTTDATLVYTAAVFAGMLSGDALTVTATGTFADANKGENKTVALTQLALGGRSAGNYVLAVLGQQASTTATIRPIVTTLTLTAESKDYNGSAVTATIETCNLATAQPVYTYYTKAACAPGDKTTVLASGAEATGGAPKNAGTYWVKGVIAEGEGNYSGATSLPVSFTIRPKTLSGVTVAPIPSATYTRQPQQPAPTVTDGVTPLTAGTDYTVAYENNTNAGTAKITLTGQGNYTGTKLVTFVIQSAERSVTFASTDGFRYDGKGKAVPATVTPIEGDGPLTVLLSYQGRGDTTYPATTAAPVAAGSYTVTATDLTGLGAANYRLGGVRTKDYTIGKANRNLALSSTTLLLSGDTLRQTITYTCANWDSSAQAVYSTDSSAVRVTSSGTVIAVANGTATVRLTMAETANYTAATADCTVTAVTQALTAAAVTSSADADKLSAVVAGSTLRVVGLVTPGSTLTIVPAYAEHVALTETPPQSLTIAATEQALKAGSRFVVTSSNGTDSNTITYQIDTSAVLLKPAGIVLLPTDKLAGIGQAITDLGEDIKNAIAGALNDAATKTEGFDAAAAAAALEGALQAKVDKAKEIKEAMGEATYNITAKITVDINATGYTPAAGSALAHFTADITPKITYTAVEDGGSKALPLETKTLDNADIHAPITVSMALPAGFVADLDTKLIVKHTTAGGGVEYLRAVLSGGTPYVATWQQSSFSPVELYADPRGGNIKFTFHNGDTQTIAYDGTSLNQPLPKDSYTKNDYTVTFDGWRIGSTVYSSVTGQLLDALQGGSVSAVAQFTETAIGRPGGNPGGIPGGGTTTPEKTVVHADGSATTTVTDSKTGTVTRTTVFPDQVRLVEVTPTTGKRTLTVTVPQALGAVPISLPAQGTGTLVALVKADGTREIIQKSIHKDGMVLFLMAGTGQVELTENPQVFSDVPAGSWYRGAVDFVSSHALFSGSGEGKFQPTVDMTRAMLVTVLHRLEGAPQATTPAAFGDVVPGSYYAPAASWASGAGIVLGSDAGFQPDAAITREGLVTMLWRYCGAPVLADYTGLSVFTDVGQISPWAGQAMAWAHQVGLLSGRTATTLSPGGTASRAEVSALFERLVTHLVTRQATSHVLPAG